MLENKINLSKTKSIFVRCKLQGFCFYYGRHSQVVHSKFFWTLGNTHAVNIKLINHFHFIGLIFVNDCPTEPTEVVEASQRLKCDEDRYGHNQYMCVPNKEKTSLVEFCYDGIMGIQKEGRCY